MTTPTMVRRCQNGMRLYSTGAASSFAGRRLSERQRLAPRESLLGPVPVGDLLFAELPAEEHVLVTPACREVEQALLERLDLCARRVDALGALRDRSGRPLHRGCGLAQIARLHVAAVPGDACDQLGLLRLRGHEVAAMLDHLLHDRSQLHERGVRFLDREDPRHHATIMLRPWAWARSYGRTGPSAPTSGDAPR